MQDLPEVSVIMPARDCRPWLPRAVASVLDQQDVTLELIVADDGSTDGSLDWLRARATAEPRLRLLSLDGVGASAARNRALQTARGALVAFLDADDSWRPGKVAAQVDFHRRHPQAVLSFTDYLHVDPDGGTHGSCFAFWPRAGRRLRGTTGFRLLDDGFALVLAENPVGTSTVMARRDALLAVAGFDTSLPSAADWDLWLRLALRGPVGACGEVMADYLMRPGSISGDRSRRLAALRRIVDRHAASVRPGAPDAVRAARSRIDVAEAEIARAAGQRRVAAAAHLRALCRSPSLRIARAAASDLWRLARPA